MTRNEYFKSLAEAYDSGKISAEAYDAAAMNADAFEDDDDDYIPFN